MKTWKKLSLMMVAGALGCTLAWAADAKKETADKDTYPLDTCVVSGGKLGGMGEAVKFDYNGREVRFCCKGCIDTFKKNPEKYLKILDAAAKARAEKDAGIKAPETTTAPAKKDAGHEHPQTK